MGEYKLREWMEEREKLNNDSGKNSSVSKDESKIVSTGKSMAQAILAITGGKYDLVTEVPSAFMLPRSPEEQFRMAYHQWTWQSMLAGCQISTFPYSAPANSILLIATNAQVKFHFQ